MYSLDKLAEFLGVRPSVYSFGFKLWIHVMEKTFLQVQKQIAQLQKEAEHLRKKEADGVLTRIKEAIAIYGFTAEELGVAGAGRATRKSSLKNPVKQKAAKAKANGPASVASKYKDDNGNTWGGRGPRPAWFKEALAAGKTAEDLLA